MKRLFIILPFLCLSTLTVSAEQETTSTAFIANPDGTSTLRVIEPGKEPVVYSISQGGTNVLMKIGLEEPMFADMTAMMMKGTGFMLRIMPARST